jgi:hypothetical protein
MSPFCCSQAEHLYVCKRTSEEADQVKKLLRSSILIAFALIVGSMVAVLPGYAASLKSVFRAMGRNPYWAPGIHNIYRDQHCVPPASRSADLQREAQDWANRCTFSHSGVANRGENLYWGPAGTNLDSNWAAVRWWYNEINQYNFGNPGFSQKTGHSTQVIWRDSALIGCGRGLWTICLLGMSVLSTRELFRSISGECTAALQVIFVHVPRAASALREVAACSGARDRRRVPGTRASRAPRAGQASRLQRHAQGRLAPEVRSSWHGRSIG